MTKNYLKLSLCFFALVILLFSTSPLGIYALKLIPVTSSQSSKFSYFDELKEDKLSEANKHNSSTAISISSLNIPTFPVVQQPSGHPEFVSSEYNKLTQFSSAQYFGSLGFLAHNTLAGDYFERILTGDLIFVTMDNYEIQVYKVNEIMHFQANSPSNPYSSFLDLATDITYSAEDLFYMTYGVSGRLILQTCISKDGIDNWGRLFIIAEPVDFQYTAYTLGVIKIAN